jgi:hypothetical protein
MIFQENHLYEFFHALLSPYLNHFKLINLYLQCFKSNLMEYYSNQHFIYSIFILNIINLNF